MDAFAKVSQIALALAQDTNPALAEQLAMIMQGVMGDAGMNLSAGQPLQQVQQRDAEDNSSNIRQEHPLVAKARERAENATRPS